MTTRKEREKIVLSDKEYRLRLAIRYTFDRPLCSCGCGQCVNVYGQRFVHGHSRRVIKSSYPLTCKIRDAINYVFNESPKDIILCKCGCNKEVDNTYKKYKSCFIHGHNKARLGIKNTEKQKIKWKISNLGYPMFGSYEIDKNIKIGLIRLSKLERKLTYKQSYETRQKKSKSMLGHIVASETRQKISKKLVGRMLSQDIKIKISTKLKGRKLSFLHKEKIKKLFASKEFKDKKIKLWKDPSYRKKIFGKFKQRKSFPERKLFSLVKNIFPEAIDDGKIITSQTIKFPDILIRNLNLIVEYDGIFFHKNIETDKTRDFELINAGYKILHYQGYLPSEQELRDDILNLTNSNMNVKYKRFEIDITKEILNFKQEVII